MTASQFSAYEDALPALLAERSMRLAEAALYPHLTRDGAAKLWESWATEIRAVARAASTGAASLLTFNGRPISFGALKHQLGRALGRGLTA